MPELNKKMQEGLQSFEMRQIATRLSNKEIVTSSEVAKAETEETEKKKPLAEIDGCAMNANRLVPI